MKHLLFIAAITATLFCCVKAEDKLKGTWIPSKTTMVVNYNEVDTLYPITGYSETWTFGKGSLTRVVTTPNGTTTDNFTCNYADESIQLVYDGVSNNYNVSKLAKNSFTLIPTVVNKSFGIPQSSIDFKRQ
jgi:hypothetical protein